MWAKFSVISQLARYMSRQGQEVYIPPLPKSSAATDFIPYIFTFEQIGMIFDKSSQLRIYDAHMNSTLFCIPAIVRLLYATGVRISSEPCFLSAIFLLWEIIVDRVFMIYDTPLQFMHLFKWLETDRTSITACR